MTIKFSSGQFPSEIVKSRKIADFICTETVYASNQKLSKHSHERASLVIVIRGGFTENCGRKSFLCSQSSVVFRPADATHSNHFHESDGRCLTIEFTSKWLDEAREHFQNRNNLMFINNSLVNSITTRLYREFNESDKASEMAAEGLITLTIAEMSRRFDKKHSASGLQIVKQAQEILNDRFTDNLTLTKVAEIVGTHPVYLAREFRQHYRCTVGEYIRYQRIQYACQKLSKSQASLAEIALECGFSDQSHFSRIFKQLTGVTPAQYRASL